MENIFLLNRPELPFSFFGNRSCRRAHEGVAVTCTNSQLEIEVLIDLNKDEVGYNRDGFEALPYSENKDGTTEEITVEIQANFIADEDNDKDMKEEQDQKESIYSIFEELKALAIHSSVFQHLDQLNENIRNTL